jgi:hypothetical protein
MRVLYKRRGRIHEIGYHFICFDACEIGRLKIYVQIIIIYMYAPGDDVFIVCARVRACVRIPIYSPSPSAPSGDGDGCRVYLAPPH